MLSRNDRNPTPATTEQNPDLQVDELTGARVLEGLDRPGVGGA